MDMKLNHTMSPTLFNLSGFVKLIFSWEDQTRMSSYYFFFNMSTNISKFFFADVPIYYLVSLFFFVLQVYGKAYLRRRRVRRRGEWENSVSEYMKDAEIFKFQVDTIKVTVQ